ncbi:hypothetical protein LCGC14_0827860 [marine sediment metagenome]|uniref:Uncharacterized protein n=1 Tax=marine sediment metagenome TaxID=412755 RepID=A0A0F9S1N1_9ZZZZ
MTVATKSHLKRCPNCGHTARQRGGPNSFVSCGGVCPVASFSIPVAAWQSWPRDQKPAAPVPRESKSEQQQRSQEIAQLQKRLAEFGDVKQQCRQLQMKTEKSELELTAEQRRTKQLEAKRYSLGQSLEKVTMLHDTVTLQLNKITKWAIKGAQVAWAAENALDARFFEEALEQLGKRNATEVKCAICLQLPGQHQYHDRPEQFSCKCSGTTKYTAAAWLRRQRDILVARTRDKPRPDDQYLRNIESGRKFATEAGTGPAAAMLRLQADQNELLIQQTDLLKQLAGKS